MGHRSREIESKLVVKSNIDLNMANVLLDELFGTDKDKLLFGSSADTYWTVSDPGVSADFARMRERDGIRQLTVKGKDKGNNLDRIEIDIDCTSEPRDIIKFFTALLGKSVGKVGKTYYVYWITKSEHDTVCCYTVRSGEADHPNVFIEVEATTTEKMLDMEKRVIDKFVEKGYAIERAPGSLYEMFVIKKFGDM